MNKILKNAASVTLSTSSYATPTANVIEVRTEGVLCQSGEGSFNDLDDSNYVNW